MRGGNRPRDSRWRTDGIGRRQALSASPSGLLGIGFEPAFGAAEALREGQARLPYYAAKLPGQHWELPRIGELPIALQLYIFAICLLPVAFGIAGRILLSRPIPPKRLTRVIRAAVLTIVVWVALCASALALGIALEALL